MSERAIGALAIIVTVIAVTSTLTATLNTYRYRTEGSWPLRTAKNASAWFCAGVVFTVPWLLYAFGSGMSGSSCGPNYSSPPLWPVLLPLVSFLATPVVIGTLRLNRPRPMRPLVYLLLYFALAPIVVLAVWAIQEGWIGEVCMLPTLPVVVGGIATPSAACTLDLMLHRRISVQV